MARLSAVDGELMKKITTCSGATYILHNDGRTITGGSKKLRDGHLLTEPNIGSSMLISTPERLHVTPFYDWPGVGTSMVIKIEEISRFRYLLAKLFGG